jgi:hypothetical protein
VEAWEERAEEFRATEPPDEPEWRAAEEAAALLPGAEAAWLLRCLVGDPWRPVLVDPEWVLGPRGVLPLAQAAAEERTAPHGQLDGDRLRVLADALEEAGCADAAILQHLRQPGPHAPGCHVLEALLGRD